MNELEELKLKVERQQEIIDAILRVLWHERGVMKGVATNLDSIRGKVEKELGEHFQDLRDREIPKS